MSKIHPTAIVDSSARLGDQVEIGPYCIVEKDTIIGDGTVLQAHAMVRRWTELGKNNVLLPGALIGGEAQHLAYHGEETWLRIGDDNRIGEYVTLHRGSKPGSDTLIGSNCYFMAYSHVGHDCHVGNHVVMTNYAGLAGHSEIEDRVIVAGYAGTHQFVRVGTLAMLGGGALCGQDVVPYATMQGMPAQPRSINKIGMERNGIPPETIAAIGEAHKILFSEGLALPNAIEKIQQELPDLPEIRHIIEFIQQSKRGIARRKVR